MGRNESQSRILRKSMHWPLVVLISLSLASGSFGQETSSPKEQPVGVIVPERPDQTNAPELVPKGFVQWESGFIREQDKSGDVSTTNYLFNTSLIRYGLSDLLELRLQIEYAGQKIEHSSASFLTEGLNPVVVGTKFFLCDPSGLIPQSSVSLSLTLPYFGASEFRPTHIAPSIFFLFENEFSERISLGYNLGLQWDGTNQNATSVVTASLGISLSERVNVFLEAYSFAARSSGPDHRADAGLSVLVLQNLMLDASGGVGLNALAPDSFVSFGFSWRLPN